MKTFHKFLKLRKRRNKQSAWNRYYRNNIRNRNFPLGIWIQRFCRQPRVPGSWYRAHRSFRKRQKPLLRQRKRMHCLFCNWRNRLLHFGSLRSCYLKRKRYFHIGWNPCNGSISLPQNGKRLFRGCNQVWRDFDSCQLPFLYQFLRLHHRFYLHNRIKLLTTSAAGGFCYTRKHRMQ